MEHILERSIIHFFSGAGVYLIAFFGLAYVQRKWPGQFETILPAVLAVLIIALREPFDVANGQSVVKVVFDWLSWSLGLAAGIWGMKRYVKYHRV